MLCTAVPYRVRLRSPGLARQGSTCTLSWVDGRGRGVGLRGGNGVDPDKHASFSALTVVFVDSRGFHCCLSSSLLALVSASETNSARDAIFRAGCRFPALASVSLLAPVSLLTAVSHIDCCSHVDCCFSGRLLFSRLSVIFRVNCRFDRQPPFLGIDVGLQQQLLCPCSVSLSVSSAVFNVDRGF